jgi:RNA polymerase sigma-70 factor (ECF subfamily)
MTRDLDAVMADAAGGDPAALREVYDRLAPRVRGYLDVRGAEDPEGLTNEVFVTVIPRLAEIENGWEGLRALVFSVAHARMVDDVRRRQRRPRHHEYDPADDPRVHGSAEDEALGNVRSRELLDLLDLLPEAQRSVVILRVLGDLTIGQTATAVGRSEPAVKKLQHKALTTLRTLVAERAADPGTPGIDE